MSRRTTLFVAGINPRTRARDLAYEFERYGRLVRCDIPAPRGNGRPFAFVEFVDPRDAQDAYNELHGVRVDGQVISLQWARTPGRRDDHYSGSAPGGGAGGAYPPRGPLPGADYRDLPPPRGRSRSPPPPRGRPMSPPRGRSRSPVPRRDMYPNDMPAPRRGDSRDRRDMRSPPPPPRGGDVPPPSRSNRTPSPVPRERAPAGESPVRSSAHDDRERAAESVM